MIWKIGERVWLTCSTSLPEQNSCCKLIEGWNLQYIFSICTHFIINQPWCIKHNLLKLGLTAGRSMYIQVCTLKRVLAETHTLCHEYPHHWCLSYPETCLCLIQRPACFTVTTEGLTQRLVTPPPTPYFIPLKNRWPLLSISSSETLTEPLYCAINATLKISTPLPPFSLPVNSGRSSSSWNIRF